MTQTAGFGVTGRGGGAVNVDVFQAVQEARCRFLDTLSGALRDLAAAGRWQDAIRLVVGQGRISEAELARGLEVTRSTVNRWMNGQTIPQARAMAYMVEKIQRMLRE